MNKQMDGYDVVNRKIVADSDGRSGYELPLWAAYRYEKPNVGKPVKVYKFGYPDYNQ